jgi:hypothetical protein
VVLVAGHPVPRFRAALRALAEELAETAEDPALRMAAETLAGAWRAASAWGGPPSGLRPLVLRAERDFCRRLLGELKTMPLRVPQPSTRR